MRDGILRRARMQDYLQTATILYTLWRTALLLRAVSDKVLQLLALANNHSSIPCVGPLRDPTTGQAFLLVTIEA